MSWLEARDSEMELLISMFKPGEELIFEDTDGLDSLTKPDQQTVGFVVKLLEVVELTFHLPPGYPSGNPENPVLPSVTVRLLPSSAHTVEVNERAFAGRFNKWLDKTARSGEPIICSAIDWIQTQLTERQAQQEHIHRMPNDGNMKGSSVSFDVAHPESTVTEDFVVCLWIVSHHIRNPVKRRLILDWAAELNLAGCSMPGKPGLVIAEGEAHNADEYWRRLRGLQWKHIQVRDREVLGSPSYRTRRFRNTFEELFLAHQSRFQWLNERGISSDQFKLVFGIPGRLPHVAETNTRDRKT